MLLKGTDTILLKKRDNSKQLSLEKIMEECGDIFPERNNVSDENEIKIIINKFLMELPLKKKGIYVEILVFFYP